MITRVPREPLAFDTPMEVERRQIETWRAMSPADKAALVTGLTKAAFELALAGVRDRYPNASPAEHRLRLAVLTLGTELAQRAYPDVAALTNP